MPFAEFLNPAPAVSGLGAFLGSEKGRERDAARSAAPAPPLPCQSSNNSDETASKLSPYQRKNAFSINENLNHLIEIFGLEKIGFLTLTFPKDLTLKEANRRLNSLARRFLDEHFEAWLCVREFTKGGRPHLHLVVVCKGDIRQGFNFENFTRLAFLTARPERRRKHAKEIRALSRSLSPGPLLKTLWSELRRVLPLYQFGRHELAPVRKSGPALARYVGGYIRKSMDFRPLEAKGARLVTYSKGFPRKIVGHAWAFNTPGSALWRKKVQTFAELHRIKDLDEMAKRFGPRWAWWFKDLIETINLVPVLPGDGVSVYLREGGRDLEMFTEAIEIWSVHVLALHLRMPELPEVDGKRVQPPARLRSVFDFHLTNWRKTRDEIAFEKNEAKRKMSEMLVSRSGMFHTSEAFVAARAALLAPRFAVRPLPPPTPFNSESPAALRARNFARLVHPEYYSSNSL